MRTMGPHEVIPDQTQSRSAIRPRRARWITLNRQFKTPKPDILWLSDFTDVATWTGFVYLAFVIDAMSAGLLANGSLARRTLTSCSTRWDRPVNRGGLVHHCDRGSQFASNNGPSAWRKRAWSPLSTVLKIPNHQRSPQGRGEPPVRVVAKFRDSKVRHPRIGRLVQPSKAPLSIGNIPPAAAEQRYYAMPEEPAMAA